MVLASVIRQSLAKRIPMIRFRKGGDIPEHVIAASIVGGQAAAGKTVSSGDVVNGYLESLADK